MSLIHSLPKLKLDFHLTSTLYTMTNLLIVTLIDVGYCGEVKDQETQVAITVVNLIEAWRR